ncbi:MAG: gamma-glutamylcyclotransferase [Deltaproteobacteria bacterium]|nr:gamma-glutamylcyclotransferase [Deltaproteobacteria bacterium]
MKNWTYIFVYGQLRRGMNHPMQNLLVRHATYLGTGYFQGKLYDLGRYPGAVHSRSPKDRVIGDIYRIDEAAHVIGHLDEYEGRRFTREEVSVRVDHEDQIRCWAYLYTRATFGRVRIPSGDYIEYCQSLARV